MQNFKFDNDGYLTPQQCKDIADHLYQLSEEYSIEQSPLEHRNHLGISIVGRECSREIWYSFRWAKLNQFSGRMRRLFLRGHEEEVRFVNLLSWMGFFVREIDPNTNKQYRVLGVQGHYGGSTDSLLLMPWDRQDETKRILGEYKTHNKKSFENLVKNKLRISKPEHYAQMCGYGYEFKVRYGLYCAYNKDDSDYYFEMIELDWNYAVQLEHKAADIIQAKLPPPRISDNPDYYKCKFCDFSGICHRSEPVEKNCRSCKFASPVPDAKWFCARFCDIIPQDFIKVGCDGHTSIND